MFKKMKNTILNKWIKSNKKGFTLIEMLIVLVVVALLMAIIIPNISGQREKINTKADENIVQIVNTQAETFRLSENKEPSNLEELESEGYLTSKQLEAAKDYEQRKGSSILR